MTRFAQSIGPRADRTAMIYRRAKCVEGREIGRGSPLLSITGSRGASEAPHWSLGRALAKSGFGTFLA